jgi:hypothetical protein
MCRYIFMAVYSFMPSLREAKFYGVPSCVFEKLWCAAGEERIVERCCGTLFALLGLSVGANCLDSS